LKFNEARAILKETFGYDSFRKGQAEIVKKLIKKQDTVGIMPTGGGKSLCYQIPALMFDGLTLVISPLISLMKDQVDALEQEGISAAFINSSVSFADVKERLTGAATGKYKLLYVAPERLESGFFANWLEKAPLSLIAIDEAHCISQWGHDFRPSYLLIRDMIERLPKRPPIVALTATATPKVTDDICQLLNIGRSSVVASGFRRENLVFRVVKGQDRDAFLKSYLKINTNQSGIIYAATRKEVDRLQSRLNAMGFSVGKYHAGMPEEERNKNQEQFLYDDVTIMVATSAFGMGINKSNVRYVIHYHLPKNIESYYQEAGRAGRDGEESECVLLYAPQDSQLPKFFIEQSDMDEDRKKNEFEKLQQMIGYCHTESCLQQYVLAYFGEKDASACEICGNCSDDRIAEDITQEAQMVFSCVKRMRERFGKTMVAKVLTGSRDQKIRSFGLDSLPTFGIMKERTQKQVSELIDFFTAEQYLLPTGSSFPVLALSNKAVEVLQGKETVSRKEQIEARTVVIEDELFERLRALRKQLADQKHVPPFVIFSDATLHEMCTTLPASQSEMLSVKGIGQRKLKAYGEAFLKVIEEYEAENTVKA